MSIRLTIANSLDRIMSAVAERMAARTAKRPSRPALNRAAAQ
jgi:hypothetical protein